MASRKNKQEASTGRQQAAQLQPMAARVVKALPEGGEWLYEVKFDDYRAVLIKDGNPFAEAGLRVNAARAVIDGEIVAVDSQGRPSFQALQHRGSHANQRIVFYAFDFLHLDGVDLTHEPLRDRRALLPQVLEGSGLVLSRELPGTPSAIVAAARNLGLEGVVAKRKDSVYEPGERSGAWQKLKLELSQEFVVGGYRPGFDSVDALLVGYYKGRKLRFAGKVKAGFVPHSRRELFRELQLLRTGACPFAGMPNARSDRWGGGVTAEDMREMQWVEPETGMQVRFVEWTAEGRLRHAVFVGLRADKEAGEVRRE